LSTEHKDLLKGSYPETDFEKCWIFEAGREPGGFFKIILIFIGAAVLLLGGAAGLIVGLKQKSESNESPSRRLPRRG